MFIQTTIPIVIFFLKTATSELSEVSPDPKEKSSLILIPFQDDFWFCEYESIQ